MNDKPSYVSLEYTPDAETAKKFKETAEEIGMPEEGVYMLAAIEKSIQNGKLDPEEMLSGQDMLIAIAEKLDFEGDNPKIVAEMAEKLRGLSYFATTHLVPVTPP